MPTVVFAGLPFWAIVAVIAAGALVLGMLHRLRVRPRRVTVITTLFWREAAQHTQASSLHRRFRHPRTYLFLLSISVLLALALGDPLVRWSGRPSPSHVVVLDGGVSMNAADDEGTWRDGAVAAAVREVGRVPGQDAVAVVAVDPWPRLVLGFDEPRALLPLRLKAVPPAEAPADREAGLSLAADLIRQRGDGKIVLITTPAVGEVAIDGAPLDVRIVAIGTPVDNAAILTALFEARPGDPLSGRVVARAGYWGAAPRDVQVRFLAADDTELQSASWRFAPNEERDFVVDDVPADGSVLRITLASDDGLPTDNQLALRLPRRFPIRVRVPMDRFPLVEAILSADAAVQLNDEVEGTPVDVVVTDATDDEAVPSLVIHAAGAAISSPRTVQVAEVGALVNDLTFGGTACAAGPTIELAAGESPCLLAGGRCVAAADLRVPQPHVRLSPALVDADASVARHPALAAFVTRAIRALAGWQDAVVLPAGRAVTDPLWADRRGVDVSTVAGARVASNLMTTPGTNATRDIDGTARRVNWQWFQLLLVIPAGLMFVEAWLHTRGRIP